jgi:hypothetical protein
VPTLKRNPGSVSNPDSSNPFLGEPGLDLGCPSGEAEAGSGPGDYLRAHCPVPVGADNYAEGLPGDQYVSITHALLRAIRASYRGEWTTALSSGWVEYLIWIRTQLLAGAASAQENDQLHQAEVLHAAGTPVTADSQTGQPSHRNRQQGRPPQTTMTMTTTTSRTPDSATSWSP